MSDVSVSDKSYRKCEYYEVRVHDLCVIIIHDSLKDYIYPLSTLIKTFRMFVKRTWYILATQILAIMMTEILLEKSLTVHTVCIHSYLSQKHCGKSAV